MTEEWDALLDRIEQGMSTTEDALMVGRLMARLEAYEAVLHWIAVEADGDAALRIVRALVGAEANDASAEPAATAQALTGGLHAHAA